MPMADRLEIVRADITTLRVDAVVNAANTSLLGGGGVDGAIHRAAGPALLAECRTLGGCPTGEARLTKGYGLPASWVIHAVGPVWQGGGRGEDAQLAGCYRSAFALARAQGVRSIAVPAISTGVYRFPAERAAAIALTEIRKGLDADPRLTRVVVACFDEGTERVYRRLLGQPAGPDGAAVPRPENV